MENKEKSIQNENKFSSLICLIKRESFEEIKEILHKWSNLLNLKDQSGRTALHYCSEHSSALCADFILEKCPNLLTAQDNEGYTALHLSVISGNPVMTRYLIDKSDGNYINDCDYEKHTSIHWATVCGQLQCLDLLLNSGAHSSRADIHGAYPLHYSAQMCSPYSGICIGNDSRIGLSVLNRLLQCPDIDVDCIDSDGRTPLLWAASAEIGVSKINSSSGSAEALLILINVGASVSAKDKDGLTALHCASSRGHIDCVETLLTLCGADINQMDANGCPPLFYAVTLGHADCTRLLIESGADVNVQDFKGRTAAHCGAARGQFETIKILGQLGANLWLRNSRGDLPLHEAVKSGRKELVKWLLDQIPSAVNATNSFGRSVLHIAAINNNIEMCKILIDTGADVNTVMKMKGHFITPLDAALQKGYRGVAKYLLLHGALPASRISHSLNKSTAQRCPTGRPNDSFHAFENSSPIDSYDEWKTRSQSTDSPFLSQNHLNPMENSMTQLPKLPTLVKNSTEEQHIQETSSSTASSLIDNTNHYKNIREFETPLNTKGSNLKQAIITNVYVTNTPICHSKRVPPLKKIKKRRKTIQENEDLKGLRVQTESMSSSSSVITGEDNVKVVMETKDDSSFKLNDSLNEKLNSSEEYDEKLLNTKLIVNLDQKSKEIDSRVESDFEEEVSKEYFETNEEIIPKLINEETIETNTKQNEEILNNNKESDKEYNLGINDNQTKETDLLNNKSVDNKTIEMSAKSVGNSEISDKNQSSAKSKSDDRPKRSISRRRSSVIDINKTQSIDKKTDIKQKSVNKTNETLNQKKGDKNIEKTSVTSTKSKARKEFEEKSKNLAENIDKKKKDITKGKARKEFSDKLNKLNEKVVKTDKSEPKSKKDLSTESTNKSKTMSEDTDDNRDIDSITYIKSDNDSTKSALSSGKEKTDTNLEEDKSVENGDQLKEQKSKEINENTINSEKSSLKDSTERKGEYEEYFDQWESDSEKTVIDSQNEQKSVEDINNNNIVKLSADQKSRQSDKIKDNSDKQRMNSNKHKDTKSTPKDNSIKSKNNEKVKRNEVKAKDKCKDDSDKSVKSNKSLKTIDKTVEKKVSSDQTKKTTDKLPKSDKRPSISRGKAVMNNNNKPIEKKSTNVSKVKPKSDKKVINSLENKSFLSTSDMSLNKSSDNKKSELKSNHLKTSISNQEINEFKDNDKNLPNFSSEESIFDSSLVMADMEISDSRMYSDIDKTCAKDNILSPLEHIQRNSSSPVREQLDVCTVEYCNSNHKPESRCSHKYHFKTMPPHLGKVEVAHIGSRVDSRRDNRYSIENKYNRERVRVVRVRPSSDGYKSIDPNIITQTVEKSLRKYQLERKLFEELHELKRFQIRSGRSNEILMVKRLVDKFRRDVKAPGMTDFNGSFTYKNYEFYLYDQLRRLSTSNEGKVALLTRSVSHENILMIRNLNENITQSSPEIMQNSEGLDTNHQNISKTHEIHKKYNQFISDFNENVSENKQIVSTEEEVIEKFERKTVFEANQNQTIESKDQKDLGNEYHIINNFDNFDNESQINDTNSEQKTLDQSICDQNVTDLTQNSTHYQNSDVISESFRITEGVSHIIIDSNKESNELSEQKSQIIQNQNNSTKSIDTTDQQNTNSTQISEQRDGSIEGSIHLQNESLIEKIDRISDFHSNFIISEALNQQINKSLDMESNLDKQKDNKSLTLSQTTLESNESQITNQISTAKSTAGSLKSAKVERKSQNSSVSRKTSSKSNKSINNSFVDKRRAKERQTFKKECLKPVKDMEPSERAKNRKKFKRLKTKIPSKIAINISIDEIKSRWKDIKETEMKKVFILSAHKQNELISGYTLWFELNKNLRNKKNKSIDYQIDRYINENRNGLQRTHSDSYLNRYKLDSDFIT